MSSISVTTVDEDDNELKKLAHTVAYVAEFFHDLAVFLDMQCLTDHSILSVDLVPADELAGVRCFSFL